MHLSAHDGCAAADGPARLQARDEELLRSGPAGLGAPGPATHRHDLGSVAVSDRTVDLRVLPARRERSVVLGAVAAHRQHGRRHRCRALDAHRCHQPRARHHLHSDRPAGRGPPLHRRLVCLWTGHDERESTDLRGDERRAQSPTGRPAGDLGQTVERRLSVAGARRSRAAHRSGSGSLSQGSGRCVTGGAARNARRAERAQSPAPSAGGRPGDAGAHRAVRDGLSHADVGAGDGRSLH